MSELVRIEDHDRVRHVILNRPEKRNAFNADLIAALRDAVYATEGAKDAHVVILRGEGKVFSAGVDLTGIGDALGDNVRTFRRAWVETVNAIESMPKVWIAQIHGSCVGGALETALGCDLRVATTDTLLGLPETKIGLVPDVGGSSRLPAVVGLGRAKELLLTSRLINGTEAERIGLVNRAVAPEDLEEATQALVDELLQCSPTALGQAKRVMDLSARPALATALEHEITANEVAIASPHFGEAAQAFMEKRAPTFS